MARWKLTAKHYLNVPGNEWEYAEVTNTGKQFRKRFEVPLFLDPDDREYQNPMGELIVAYAGPGAQSTDVIFTGLPTPDMEPLDAEAEALTAAERPKWVHPIESLPGQGGDYSASLLTMLERQMGEAMKNLPRTTNTPATGIDPTEFEQMKVDLAALMAENVALKAGTDPKPARRL